MTTWSRSAAPWSKSSPTASSGAPIGRIPTYGSHPTTALWSITSRGSPQRRRCSRGSWSTTRCGFIGVDGSRRYCRAGMTNWKGSIATTVTLPACSALYMADQTERRPGETSMSRKKQVYDDIPGTFVFDAERSRQGFGINMFCMSLMKDENRKSFKADEADYLKRFKLTPEQTEAVLKRDYNRMLELGGNIYFTAKLGATDGHSFQHLAAVMTGASQQDYAKMMIGGGRNVEGNRSRTGKNTPSKFLSGSAPAKSAAAKPKAKTKSGKTKSSKPKSKSKSA